MENYKNLISMPLSRLKSISDDVQIGATIIIRTTIDNQIPFSKPELILQECRTVSSYIFTSDENDPDLN